MPKYNPSMPSATFDYADTDAIMRSSIPQGLVNDALRFDSAEDASVFFARELDYVKAQSYDKEYPELTALKLFPVSHEVPEGAETVTYYGYEKTGFAKIISNYATDLPRADVKGKPTTAQIKSIGDSYGYSMQDMRASRLAGKSLDVRRGEAAKYQIDRLMNKIAWAGDEEAGLVGVLSANNNVPVYTLADNAAGTSKAWKDKDQDEIIADISGMRQFMATTTMNVEVPDTVIIPPSVRIALGGRRIEGTSDTVFSFITKAFPELTWVEAPELEANSGDVNPYGKALMIMFKNDPSKLTIEVPLDFYQYAAQPEGLEIQIPCEARIAGALMYYPMSMLIAAGI